MNRTRTPRKSSVAASIVEDSTVKQIFKEVGGGLNTDK